MEAASSERANHLYLSYEQRQELKQVVNHDTPARGRRARALLLLDEGPHGPGLSPAQTAERVGMAPSSISSLVQRTVEQGPKKAAIGHRGEAMSERMARRWSELTNRGKLTDEQQQEIAEAYGSGKFTQQELARRYGVSQPTIGRIFKQFESERDR